MNTKIGSELNRTLGCLTRLSLLPERLLTNFLVVIDFGELDDEDTERILSIFVLTFSSSFTCSVVYEGDIKSEILVTSSRES
ncbi:unnamed protein product [Schistosoma margrebowiei]|uniref:Uncharacterized protein n=1 Tax=Schistosoma margrebowiei TaxID=48269 RepID=A0A3P7ZVN0_9TREM|nr:unnamed protein product [Schistosoma margrebowiei]